MTSKQWKTVLDAYFKALMMASNHTGVSSDLDDYKTIVHLYNEYNWALKEEEANGTQQ